MYKTNLYQVSGTPYQLEELPTGSGLYVIWDARLEAAMDRWENSDEDEEEWHAKSQPPSPIVQAGITFEEARDWIKQELGIIDSNYVYTFAVLVKRIQKGERCSTQ